MFQSVSCDVAQADITNPASNTRVRIDADAAHRTLIVRFFSPCPCPMPGPGLIEQLGTVDAPWTYDAIVDFRRFDAYPGEAFYHAARGWSEIENGRGLGAALAFITRDMQLREKLRPMAAALSQRTVCFFDTFDEGLDWVRSHAQARDAA